MEIKEVKDYLKNKYPKFKSFIEHTIVAEMALNFAKEHYTKQLSISRVVSSSNMRKALQTVVDGYESDGMENMRIRDEVFYKACKKALTFDDNTKD